MTASVHPFVEAVMAVDMPDDQPGKLITAVQWGTHDVLTCDGNDLVIDADTGFLRCPVSGCRWTYSQEATCPDHERGAS